MKIKRETAASDLKLFRESTGTTQEKLSEKTGVTRSIISRLEKGGSKPQVKTLFKLNEYISKIA